MLLHVRSARHHLANPLIALKVVIIDLMKILRLCKDYVAYYAIIEMR